MKRIDFIFNTFKEFSGNLERIGFLNETQLIENTNHEREHGDKAKELGHELRYGFSLMAKYGESIFSPDYSKIKEYIYFGSFVQTPRDIPIIDKCKIFMAPKKPSPIDIFLYNKYKEELEELLKK